MPLHRQRLIGDLRPMPFHRFTRQQMLDLVWTKPMRDVAAELGLSDVAVKKACRNADISTPTQGHWNRIHAGREGFVKPALSPRIFGASNHVTFGSENWQEKHLDLTSEILPPVFDEPMEKVRERAVRCVGKLGVSRDLERFAHDAIRKVMRDEAARTTWLIESGSTWSWDIERKGPRLLKPGDQRRLRLLSAIALGLARGGIKVADGSGGDLALRVVTEFGPLWLTAAMQAPTDEKPKQGETPVEVLTVVLSAGYSDTEKTLVSWRDVDEAKLESRVTDIAVDILVTAEDHYRNRMVAAYEGALKHRAWQIEERRKAMLEAERKERERREKLERERIERLLGEADALRQAQAIRAYVAEVERLRAEGTASVDAEAFTRWKAWALGQANRIDPVSNGAFLAGMDDIGSIGDGE